MHCLGEAAHWINGRLPVGCCVAVELRERRVLTTDGPTVVGIDFVFDRVEAPTDDMYLRDVEIAYHLSCEAFRLFSGIEQSTN